MNITLDLEYEDAIRLRDHLRDCPFTGELGSVRVELEKAIENADEARWEHLEEGKLL